MIGKMKKNMKLLKVIKYLIFNNMNVLTLIFLPSLPDIFHKYLTHFSDLKYIFIIEINLSLIQKNLKEYSNIKLILDTDNNYIQVNSNSNISGLQIPNGYYYIIRPSFQYCNNILGTIIKSKNDDILKYLF